MKMNLKLYLASLFIYCLIIQGFVYAQEESTSAYDNQQEVQNQNKATTPKIKLGNGIKNWIVIDDVKRHESTLTFSEVQIDGNGWLVMHPFENGAPNGDKHVASSYVKNGNNIDVDIKVHMGITVNEMFIVMLHRDVNENNAFDFVFIDDRNVLDAAVFEGTTMIAHVISAP